MRRFLFLGAILLLGPVLRADTLRQVLAQNNIPAAGIKPSALDSQVSSGAVGQDGVWAFVAYPSLVGKESLSPPLHVVVYNRAAQELTYRGITREDASENCFGSVWEIYAIEKNVLIQAHMNPSAMCTLVLDSDLNVRHTLYGWTVARLGQEEILLHEDEIHFAPVHAVRLGVFNPATGKWQEIYPPDGDPLRTTFSKELTQHLPPKSWCMEHDRPCDPSSFEEDLGNPVAADPSGKSFAFVITYAAFAFGEDADNVIGTRPVLYVYRRAERGWSYCQEELSDDEVEARVKLLRTDIQAAAQSCTATNAVTVKPVESPFPQPQ